jgi:hypothetical protein
MNLLIEIDQIESVKAGYDAPHSTRLMDIPMEEIPDSIRQVLINDGWEPKKKRANIGGRPIKLVLPLTKEKVLAEMNRLYAEWIRSSQSIPKEGAGT